MLSPIVRSPLNMFVELGSMALCINLLLGQKHLLLYQILLLQDMFFEKMHFVMTRYYLTICFLTPPIPPLVNMIIDVNMSLCKMPFIYVSMYELHGFGTNEVLSVGTASMQMKCCRGFMTKMNVGTTLI